MEKGFVYLDEFIPGIKWDAKYAGYDNFMGRPAKGYNANRIVIHEKAAEAMKKACAVFEKDGYTVFAFDAYRPVSAVEDFLMWMQTEGEEERKPIHYPNIDKRNMRSLGYIAGKSGHSRGSTIDLTLIRNDTGEFADMGGIFDFMDEISHTRCPLITKEQLENRLGIFRLISYVQGKIVHNFKLCVLFIVEING